MKKTTNNKVLFSVDGFDVLDNTIYRVKQKLDDTAPKEMQEKGYSKYPGAPTTAKCPFILRGNVYNTGFELSSAMYLNITDSKEKKRIVDERRKNVLEPFLVYQGLDDSHYKPSSIEEWDEVRVEISEDRVFRTNDVKDVMDLYISLISNTIIPPNVNIYDYKYSNSNFILESSKVKTKVETDNKVTKYEATSLFSRLLKDSVACVDVFVYLGYKELSNSSGNVEVMARYFEDKILNSLTSTETFIEVVNKYYDSEEGKSEIVINRIISNNLKMRNKDFGKEQGLILFKNNELGRSEKEAAEVLITNVNMKDIMEDILFNYDNKKS